MIILYIYSYLIDNNDDSDEFNIDSILDDIDLFINTNNTDANLSSTLRLVADIVSYILTDYRNTIKNQLIENRIHRCNALGRPNFFYRTLWLCHSRGFNLWEMLGASWLFWGLLISIRSLLGKLENKI